MVMNQINSSYYNLGPTFSINTTKQNEINLDF